MAKGDDVCPFQQPLANSRLFRRFSQRCRRSLFSNDCPVNSPNRVHKTAWQCLEASAWVVLADDENDITEIIQKNSICRMS